MRRDATKIKGYIIVRPLTRRTYFKAVAGTQADVMMSRFSCWMDIAARNEKEALGGRSPVPNTITDGAAARNGVS
jgi:hypothetical protein